jgi:MFS family permease
VLLSMEWARSNAHRGLIASWPQLGGPAGFFLANLAVLVFSAISGDQFLSWGWRVPFFFSIIMVGVGLYIRLRIVETPIFSRLLAENRIERAPVLEVIKRQPKSIILVALARMGEMAPAYIYGAFVLTYGVTVLGSSRDLLLSALMRRCSGGANAMFEINLKRRMTFQSEIFSVKDPKHFLTRLLALGSALGCPLQRFFPRSRFDLERR